MNASAHLLTLGLLLAAYCSLHSLLASLACKRWVARRWPRLMPAYRLLFNISALILLAPVAWLLWNYDGAPLWHWEGAAAWIANGLALAALVAFLHSLSSYDSGVFSGLAQWRARHGAPEDPERLRLSFWHRYVRHPWYFFILVMLWTREMNAAQLLTYTLVTLYFWIGSRLEERKLIHAFGEAYREYRHRVPGLVPLPGRSLSRGEARELEARARVPAKASGGGAPA